MAYGGVPELCGLGDYCGNSGKMCGFSRSFSLEGRKGRIFYGEREKIEGLEGVNGGFKRIKEACTGVTGKTGRIRCKSLVKKIKILNFSCTVFPGSGGCCCFAGFGEDDKGFGVRNGEKGSGNLSYSESQLKIFGRFKRRKERCRVLNEGICEEIVTGRIERYNLKGRFGKLVSGSHTLWVYEDDLVVSGVNLRKFKKSVRKKSQIQVTFCIKKASEAGEIKLRPVNIQLKYDPIKEPAQL